MALSINEINAVTRKLFDKKITQIAYDNSYFFKKLMVDKKITKSGGTQIQFPIRYQKLGLAGNVGWSEVINFEDYPTRTGGVLEWCPYVGKTLMKWQDSVRNSGEQVIVNLLKDKSKELAEDLEDALSTQLYSTSAPTTYQFSPLAQIIDSADSLGAYAGVAYTDASNWAGIEDGTATTLALFGANSLSYNYNQATRGNQHPTAFITTRDLFSKYISLAEAQRMYSTDDETAKMGFPNAQFMGHPVVADGYCTSGYFYGLNMNAFEVFVTDVENAENGIEVGDWFSLEQAGRPWDLAKVAKWVGNIVCRDRKTNFKMTALVYSN